MSYLKILLSVAIMFVFSVMTFGQNWKTLVEQTKNSRFGYIPFEGGMKMAGTKLYKSNNSLYLISIDITGELMIKKQISLQEWTDIDLSSIGSYSVKEMCTQYDSVDRIYIAILEKKTNLVRLIEFNTTSGLITANVTLNTPVYKLYDFKLNNTKVPHLLVSTTIEKNIGSIFTYSFSSLTWNELPYKNFPISTYAASIDFDNLNELYYSYGARYMDNLVYLSVNKIVGNRIFFIRNIEVQNYSDIGHIKIVFNSSNDYYVFVTNSASQNIGKSIYKCTNNTYTQLNTPTSILLFDIGINNDTLYTAALLPNNEVGVYKFVNNDLVLIKKINYYNQKIFYTSIDLIEGKIYVRIALPKVIPMQVTNTNVITLAEPSIFVGSSTHSRTFAIDSGVVYLTEQSSVDSILRFYKVINNQKVSSDLPAFKITYIPNNYVMEQLKLYFHKSVPYVLCGIDKTIQLLKYNGQSWEKMGGAINYGNAHATNLAFDLNDTPYVMHCYGSKMTSVEKLVNNNWDTCGALLDFDAYTDNFSFGFSQINARPYIFGDNLLSKSLFYQFDGSKWLSQTPLNTLITSGLHIDGLSINNNDEFLFIGKKSGSVQVGYYSLITNQIRYINSDPLMSYSFRNVKIVFDSNNTPYISFINSDNKSYVYMIINDALISLAYENYNIETNPSYDFHMNLLEYDKVNNRLYIMTTDKDRFTTRIDYIQSPFSIGINSTSRKSKFNIFPNPANQKITIESDLEFQTVLIYNTIGQEVANYVNPTALTFNIQNLPQGIYVLKAITKQGEEFTKRIIINE